ncbi:Non-heme 11 kDa protein of cytochrome bc1 complex [Lichtheimia hyalospora FSU 10163]|nr:Non-heme 11 kDa protein of cytochrome bc1 complex [Lichtheimia hyalospora FSU 10163]
MGITDILSSIFPTAYAEEEQVVEVVEEVVEEEEPEEVEDPKDQIMEECEKDCAALKKHLDECNERVENGSNENCIEEFFHFMHCADECAAPKIFAATK